MAEATASSAAMGSPGGSFIPVVKLPSMEPAAQAGRSVVDKVTSSAQWYLEGWEDLFVEARHQALGATHPIGVADVMALLPLAKVVSDSPGRLRIRTKALRWQEQLCTDVADTLGSLPGMEQVDVSQVTGSILIHYDKAMYASSQALMHALASS